MSKRFFARAWVLALVVAFGGAFCAAEEAVSLEGLTPGAWYEVDYERDGVKQEGYGKLMSADQEWIVIANVIRSRVDEEMSPLSSVLRGGSIPETASLVQAQRTCFIPRSAITRIAHADESKFAIEFVETPMPTVDDVASIHYVEAGERHLIAGKLSQFDATCAVFTDDEETVSISSVPLLSDLPLVGGLFKRHTYVREKVDTTIERESILLVYVIGKYSEPIVATPAVKND